MPVYNRLKADLLQGNVDLDTGGDTIKVQLHTSSYTPDVDHGTNGDLSNEVANGNGYTTGGATLANQSITQDDANDRAYLDADNTEWTSSSFTARYAVVVDTTTSNSLIGYIDFGTNVSVTSSTFTITWSSDGILRLS